MGEIIKCVKTVLAQAGDEFVAVQTMDDACSPGQGAQAILHMQIGLIARIFDN